MLFEVMGVDFRALANNRTPNSEQRSLTDSLALPAITNNQQPISSSPTPRFSLKNGTLSLLDPFAPSFNIGAEHILLPRLYAHLEAGPLFNLRLFQEPTIDNLRGYRLRGAIRYYLRPPQVGTHAAFIEILYAHQYTDVDIEGDFRRNNDLGRYRQRLWYHMEQRKQGGYFNLGLQQVYAKRFLFEFGAGLGFGHRRSIFSGVPPDASFRTNGGLGWEYDRSPNSPNVAAVQVYINLGYVLW
ncbi:MAG: hypothetical protein J5I98_22770 [Phaeodactylibacter sp.]|nr:hypothetical protein [Phaeodactylibacter sp.]